MPIHPRPYLIGANPLNQPLREYSSLYSNLHCHFRHSAKLIGASRYCSVLVLAVRSAFRPCYSCNYTTTIDPARNPARDPTTNTLTRLGQSLKRSVNILKRRSCPVTRQRKFGTNFTITTNQQNTRMRYAISPMPLSVIFIPNTQRIYVHGIFILQ